MTRTSIATLLTLAALLLLAPTTPLGCAEDPSIELRRVGTVRAEAQFDPDTAAILIDVFDADGLVEQAHVRPAPLDRPTDDPRSAWKLFTLPIGPHRLVATALDADDAPVGRCQPAEQAVEVVPIEVVAITLRPACTPTRM